MTSRTPSSHFDKTPITQAVEVGYPSVRSDVARLIESRANPELIRSTLIAHVALVNPKLAEEIMKAPTEGLVLKTIGDFAGIGERNNGTFSIEAANDKKYPEAA